MFPSLVGVRLSLSLSLARLIPRPAHAPVSLGSSTDCHTQHACALGARTIKSQHDPSVIAPSLERECVPVPVCIARMPDGTDFRHAAADVFRAHLWLRNGRVRVRGCCRLSSAALTDVASSSTALTDNTPTPTPPHRQRPHRAPPALPSPTKTPPTLPSSTSLPPALPSPTTHPAALPVSVAFIKRARIRPAHAGRPPLDPAESFPRAAGPRA